MAEQPPRDEFYTGYLPSAPPGIGRFVRRVVIALLALTVALALALTAAQQAFPAAFYEFQVFRAFEGVVRSTPYPTLEVARPGRTADGAEVSRYTLVGPGKFGADALVADHEGQRVALEGSLLYRQDQTVLEVVPGSVTARGAAAAADGEISAGRQRLVGEIVDSKCYAGLMKPDGRKPHRACAVRCISGGAPPMFVVRDASGPAAHLLLVGGDRRALGQEVLPWVAEPLAITGEVVRRGDLWLLAAEPGDFQRL